MEPWVQAAAARRPDRPAVEAPEGTLTYRELADAAARAAAALQGGARIAVALPPGLEFVVALHACLLTGAAIVPVDLRLTEAERERRYAGAELVVDEPLRRAEHAHAGHYPVDPDRTAALMHTSGTTSAPKPVSLTVGNFLASALGSAVALGLDLDERWLCPMPLTHVGGLSIPIRSAIYASTTVLHGRFDIDDVLAALSDPKQRITLVSLVPTMLARLLDAGLRDPPTLRWALLGGGPIPPALLARAEQANVPVAPTYGMTEACSQIATFGWPLPGVELRTTGAGELQVRGPIVAPGAADEDGWLHTGDLASFDERGRLRIVGRKADTIITGGENVAPTEVEDVLLEHPAVSDAAVHARSDPEWGERLVATVVVNDTVGAEELQAHCARRLARFKVPKEVMFARELPRTASGKLLRREL
jgi:O-succinylbenzoic acid--CoA ligase